MSQLTYCPLCNKLLVTRNYNLISEASFCHKTITIKSSLLYDRTETLHHFTLERNTNAPFQISYTMVVMPFSIMTFSHNTDFLYKSMIYKHNGSEFKFVCNNLDINIDPIFPAEENKMLNRLKSILVFS